MLGLGYLNPAFIPVVFCCCCCCSCSFVVLNWNPGGKALATWGRLSIHQSCQMEPALGAALSRATHTHPQPAGNRACLTHFQPWNALYLSTLVYGSWVTDAVKNHTLHCQYDFCLACSPKHCPFLCCWTEGPCAKKSLFLMGELTDKTSTPWTS